MTMLQHGSVPSTGGYQIERSLRFNSADSAYLNRTPSSTGNRRTFTFSSWVKLSSNSTDPFLMGAGSGAQIWVVGDKLRVRLNGSPDYYYDTAAVLRDFSAWYHIVVAVDTTDATSADRVKIYINGTRQTIGASSAPTLNFDTEFNLSSTVHQIGKWPSGSQYLNGYMADIIFIDGSAKTPSDFGENDTDTGVWKPKAYSGTYGTNGFYLKFADNSGTTSTTLGKDSSGNGNNWTPNNFSVTAGAGNDSLVDTPTPYGSDTGAGGEVRGNYCTLNPLKTTSPTYNGNLVFVGTSNAYVDSVYGTIGVTGSGKYYFEATGMFILGVNSKDVNPTTNQTDGRIVYHLSTDVIGVAINLDAGTLAFYKNNTQLGTNITISASSTWFPFFQDVLSGDAGEVNFGQRPFAYTAPSGYKALCTTNLPTPAIGATSTTRAGKYFDASIYTANGGVQTVTNSGFQPDFVWTKARSTSSYHILINAVTGASKYLASHLTDAEVTNANYLTSFNSDGFSLGSANYSNGTTMVGWQWKANGAGSSNTQGTITSTVSANTTSGFSIVTWTSPGGTSESVGHGLGVKPSLVILKNRDLVDPWYVWSSSFSSQTGDYLRLNTTNAVANITGLWGAGVTSSVVGVRPASFANFGEKLVMYCFAAVAGYSAFGSYTGNGSADGPFVYTGFRPRYILIKRYTSSGTGWNIYDTSRSVSNVTDEILLANASDAEYGNESTLALDALSNGFKLRTTGSSINDSSQSYIYAAFAEVPTKFSLAR
jgi:SPRY domain